jgi:hypothetical protein
MQGMRTIKEKAVVVRVRQVDLMLTKEVLDTARKSYTALFQEEAPSLTLDQATFLPPPPTGNDDLAAWWAAGTEARGCRQAGSHAPAGAVVHWLCKKQLWQGGEW